MTIQYKSFSNSFVKNSLSELQRYIIEEGISKENIVSILPYRDDHNRDAFVLWYDDGGRQNMQSMVESWIIYEPLTKEECFNKLIKIYPEKFDEVLGAVNRVFENKKNKDVSVLIKGDI